MSAVAKLAPTPSAFPFKIKTVFLHQAITWPGITGGQTTINDTKIPGIEMTLMPQGLLLRAKGLITLIPQTNIINYLLTEV